MSYSIPVHAPKPLGIYRHLFELFIKIACTITTTLMMIQAFASYFAHLDELWQFHVSFSALIILEASLLVSWFALETQPEVPVLIKIGSLAVLVTTLGVIFWVSELYMTTMNPVIKSAFLLAILGRCMIASVPAFNLSTRRTKHASTSAPIRTIWSKTVADSIQEIQRDTRKIQLSNHVDDMILRARLNEKHREALQEVETMKDQLIKKAYVKHYLAIAQINAQVDMLDKPVSPTKESRVSVRDFLEHI